MALLEWIGLGKFNSLVLRAAGGVVTILLALEASDAGEVLLGFSVVAMLTVVSTVKSTGVISLKSSVVLMTAEVITVSFVETIPMLVEVAMTTALIRVVLLVEWFHMVLVVTKLPLTVLLFLDVVVQSNCLIK